MKNRFARQITINSFGQAGQERLEKATVAIIGCGGLGSPVAMYLTRAGIGHLYLVDDDVVDVTNLHRQILFDEQDVERSKAEITAKKLILANNAIKLTTIDSRLDAGNIDGIVQSCDVIVDCTDNFKSRYLISDACEKWDKPLVYGAANQLEGQVTVLNYKGSAGLRDLFPEIPNSASYQNCEEAGVLGMVTGVIGSMMALEVVKILTGVGEPLVNELKQFDGTNSSFYSIKFKKQQRANNAKATLGSEAVKRITWDEYNANYTSFQLVDVRSLKERMAINKGGIHIPIDEFENRLQELNEYSDLAIYCRSGVRADYAAELLEETGKRIVVIKN